MDQQLLADQLMELARKGTKMTDPHGAVQLISKIIPTNEVKLDQVRSDLVQALRNLDLIHAPAFFYSIVTLRGHQIQWTIYMKLLKDYIRLASPLI